LSKPTYRSCTFVQLYRKAREIKGVKKILIGSGLRYDLAVLNPEYVKELVQHHVGGYLKIAPEHTEQGPLSKMMKPGIGTYDRFKQMFERFSKEAGKEQYLIPYFIAAHPGTTDYDMMNLAIWLKKMVSVLIRYKPSTHHQWPLRPRCTTQAKIHCLKWRVILKMSIS
jgi:radical SAM superfamily enzyme YgiQ (UPF0313 family)